MRLISIMWGGGAALLSTVAVAQQQPNYYHGPGMMGNGGWFMFGPLIMILLIAAVVVLVIAAIRWLGSNGRQSSQSSQPASKTALDILKERFARGEIDKEEFEERRRLLRDDEH